MNNLIKQRRTIRKFKQTPLIKEQVLKYIESARLAPSAANLQPLKYVAIIDKNKVDAMFKLVKWAGYLAPLYNPKSGEEPTAYIVICADNNIRKDGYDMDVGAAAENIILTALEEGVGSCWIASVDRVETKKLLNLDENIDVSCVIALGYPAESPKEVVLNGNSIKYYLDESNTLCVPKRSIDDVVIEIY